VDRIMDGTQLIAPAKKAIIRGNGERDVYFI